MTVSRTIKLRVWLTSPGDLDKLYSSEGWPPIYHTDADVDMTERGWVDLGVHELSITPPPRDQLVNLALEGLQDRLKKFDEETANARMALLSRINNLLALPLNPS